MKNTETYIVLVDSNRSPKLHQRRVAGRYRVQRRVAGRYRVGAKSAIEAERILRDKIKVGKIRTYYRCDPNDYPIMTYKEVLKEY